MHRHTAGGQALEHDHPGGDRPHGYYGHPEDAGSPGFGEGTYELVDTGSSTPMADILAHVDRAQSAAMNDGSRAAELAELAALRGLAEVVRAQLLRHPENDVAVEQERAAVRDAITAWRNGEDGARDRLNAILAGWARNCMPLELAVPSAVAENIAMTISAGISAYLEAEVLRIAAAVRAGQLPELAMSGSYEWNGHLLPVSTMADYAAYAAALMNAGAEVDDTEFRAEGDTLAVYVHDDGPFVRAEFREVTP